MKAPFEVNQCRGNLFGGKRGLVKGDAVLLIDLPADVLAHDADKT